MIDSILHDRYQLRDLLSKKQGRRTFLALDLQSQSSVIIKIVRFSPDFEWSDLKLFEREATTLQNLDYPAIPKYLDYFEVADGFALVQTHIDAPSLETVIQSGRKFSEAEVIELADRLLAILIYLHDLHPAVIHCDLKPSNILLTDSSDHSIGDVYLVDFGAVKAVSITDTDTTTCIVGTFGYMPPEQFYGRTKTGSDLYSLGMTLIQLITGVHPADLDIIDGRVTFDRTNLSNRFCRWLDKMTEYAFDRRFQSAKLAQTALTSTDGSCGEFLNLRPADSQIELHRSCDQLEIKFLQRASTDIQEDATSRCLSTLGILGFLASFIVVCGILPQTWTIISWQVRISLLAFLPMTIIVSNMYDRYINIRTYVGYQVLLVDRATKILKQGTYSISKKGACWNNQFDQGLKIDLLVYQPSYKIYEFFDEESQMKKYGSATTSPRLSIYMGKREYSIPEYDLSEIELQWLGKELSDFLDLELQVVYPTPRISAPVPDTYFGCSGCC